MGILIRVKNASFESKALAFIPPVADGLEYWNFFGSNDAKAVRNLAPGQPAATIVGTLTHNPNSVVLVGGTNYLTTKVTETPEMTLIVVAKPVSDANALLVSNAGGARVGGIGTTFGKSLSYNARSAGDNFVDVAQASSRWDGVGSASAAPGATITNGGEVGVWGMIAGRVSESAMLREVFNKTAGTYKQLALLNVGDIGSEPMRIGYGVASSLYQNPSEIAAAIIYRRALSDDEMNKVYLFLKGYYSRRGIAI